MNLEDKKDISPVTTDNRDNKDFALRPQKLEHFIGQKSLCNNLNIFMKLSIHQIEE